MSKIPLLVIVILGLVRLFSLSGGIVLGEPDEVIHLEVLKNFRNGEVWPVFAGKGWYYNFPLFLYLGWPLSYLFGTGLLSYRVISVAFSLLLALGIYFYLKWKTGKRFVGFIGAMVWSVAPFAVYYSRLGLIEMTVTSLMFLTLFSFDYAVSSKSLKWSVISGVLLSLAILTKYTAFIFVVGMVLIWGVDLLLGLRGVGGLRGVWKNLNKKEFLKLRAVYSFVPLLIAGSVTLLTSFTFYLHDWFLFKMQAGASLGIFTDFWKNVNGGYWQEWWSYTSWWVSWPVLVFAGVGFFYFGIKRVKGGKVEGKLDYFTLFFLVTTFLITTRKPFNPRYFLPIVPFLCVYAALGINWLVNLFARKSKLVSFLSYLGILGLILPGSISAFRASNHTLIESVGEFASIQKLKANSYLFSNWWPTFFGETCGLQSTWLAESVKETEEFCSTNGRSALTVLGEEGGVVLIENLYSRELYTPNVRKVAQDLVERNVEPAIVIKDLQPNFPFYKTNYNEVKVYIVKAGQRFP